MRLQPLLDGVQPNTSSDEPARPRSRVARHLSCQATQSGLLQASFCIGVRPSPARAGMLLIRQGDMHTNWIVIRRQAFSGSGTSQKAAGNAVSLK